MVKIFDPLFTFYLKYFYKEKPYLNNLQDFENDIIQNILYLQDFEKGVTQNIVQDTGLAPMAKRNRVLEENEILFSNIFLLSK